MQPRMGPTQRRTTVKSATSKTVTRSAVTGRYVAKSTGATQSAKTANDSQKTTKTRSAAGKNAGDETTTRSAASGRYVKRSSIKKTK